MVDTEKNEVIKKFPLTLAEANYPLAFNAKEGRLFVGCRKRPTVVLLDATHSPALIVLLIVMLVEPISVHLLPLVER